MSEEKTVDVCYQYNKETRDKVEKLEERHDKHAERVFQKLEALEEKLMARLPIWATLLISLLTAAIGILAGVVAKHG